MCIPVKHHATDGPIELNIKIAYCASHQAHKKSETENS